MIKEMCQRNKKVAIFGAIGFIVGCVSVLLILSGIPLSFLGLLLASVSGMVWYFVGTLACTTLCAAIPPDDLGPWFLIFTPFFYLVLGLLFGWVVAKLKGNT